MQSIELVLEYDGAPYNGWQRQDGLPSVQQTLEDALSIVTRQPAHELLVQVAGRTDRGVHARGQRVTFCTTDLREPRRFAPALNHVLPATIRVHQANKVDATFDVRKDACAKWYRYTIQLGLHRCVHTASHAWHIGQRFNVALAQQAANTLIGEQDFEAFRSVHCDAPHARRRIDVAHWSMTTLPPIGALWHLDLVGNAFCRHMCRIIAGTLVQIAQGLLPPDTIARALANKRRGDAGQTAPPQGLMLIDIAYSGDAREHWPALMPQPAQSDCQTQSL